MLTSISQSLTKKIVGLLLFCSFSFNAFSQGKIGINKTAPASMLHIKSNAALVEQISLEASSGTERSIMIYDNIKMMFRNTNAAGSSWEFQNSSGTPNCIIGSDGSMVLKSQLIAPLCGININTPLAALHIKGVTPFTFDSHIRLESAGATTGYANIVYDGNLKFRAAGLDDEYQFRDAAGSTNNLLRLNQAGDATFKGGVITGDTSTFNGRLIANQPADFNSSINMQSATVHSSLRLRSANLTIDTGKVILRVPSDNDYHMEFCSGSILSDGRIRVNQNFEFFSDHNTTGSGNFRFYQGINPVLLCEIDNQGNMELRRAVTATAFNTSSDGRLKQNIVPLKNSLNKLMQLHGYNYYWKPELNRPTTLQIGLIAQNVEQVFPELVATDIKGNKSVAYQNLIPVMLEAIREQQMAIETLKIENAQIKKLVQACKNN